MCKQYQFPSSDKTLAGRTKPIPSILSHSQTTAAIAPPYSIALEQQERSLLEFGLVHSHDGSWVGDGIGERNASHKSNRTARFAIIAKTGLTELQLLCLTY
jgi:hypothetical protein